MKGFSLETQVNYAKNIITGFIRIEGSSVGVVANQPLCVGGLFGHRCIKKGGAVHPFL